MRRPAILLSLLTSLSLVLAPLSTLHAHVGNGQGHVLMHGGHSHGADFHADHQDTHRDGKDDHDSSEGNHGDLAFPEFGHTTSVHVVQLSPVALDHSAHQLVKGIVNRSVKSPDPPPLVTSLEYFPFLDNVPAVCRAHLRPLLRGPPR